ncbi:beta-glucosidase [Polyplosphaeria fusca]|uniref:Probable beta-glucosidase G n=1 Tax=Polyplosphaeria fusca TaxID=682080 RepID=A0A9P4R3Z3_9PLEO|nr:beta-glucosidase [Polyplosphaeria fusca]
MLIFCLFVLFLKLGHGHIVSQRQSFSNSSTKLDWATAQSKAAAFVAQLTIEEKINITQGGIDSGPCVGNIGSIDRLAFPGICFQDGPIGMTRAQLVSAFPAGVTTAAIWDRELVYERGRAMGAEFKAKGAHVMLGPVVGPIGRQPLGGRNWEGFGTDPYLAGATVSATVRGLQDNGVQACTKHFVGNEQESRRDSGSSNGTKVQAISSNIDDRTLHELYAWPFADAIKAGTASIMCSYNRVNSVYACENSELLNHMLKKELGFQGYVLSDFFALQSTTSSANNGMDLEMPGRMTTLGNLPLPADNYFFGKHLLAAVQNGSVSISRLDEMATRVLTPYFLLGQDHEYPPPDPATLASLAAAQWGLPAMLESGYPFQIVPARDVRADHATIVRRGAAAGTVLLKNTNNALPLQSPQHIAILGNDAAELLDSRGFSDMNGWESGTYFIGGGSGSVNLEDTVSPLQAIRDRAKSYGASVKWLLNNTNIQQGTKGFYPVPDVCLVFLKSWATESQDRPSFELEFNATEVVNFVASWCANTVVVTHSAGVNTLPWARNANVTAILAAHYPGDQGGYAIADVLFGDQDPGGRLPYTIPEKPEDYDFPIVDCADVSNVDGCQSDFTEGQLIDYRHFDAKNITPLYEFGYGLSYTTFAISSSLKISSLAKNISAVPDVALHVEVGGHPDLWEQVIAIQATVSNIGERSGEAVPQLYISFPEGVPEGTPVKVLRGFDKILLQPGETKTVTFGLLRRDVSFWNADAKIWTVPVGEFVARAGFSSRDLPAETKFTLRK